METKFQSSFIPKRPVASAIGGVAAPKRHRTVGSLFLTFGMLVFIVSLVGVGGAYVFQGYLKSSQESLKKDLADRQQQFNIDLIEKLKQQNVKIDLAKQLINNHLALSGIFAIISQLTIENVRFTNLEVAPPTTGFGDIKVSMTGYGSSFTAVAFQSDVLGSLEQYGLRRIVKNPILSNPALSSNGTVGFTFTATLDAPSLSYAKTVAPAASSTPATVPEEQTPAEPGSPFNP